MPRASALLFVFVLLAWGCPEPPPDPPSPPPPADDDDTTEPPDDDDDSAVSDDDDDSTEPADDDDATPVPTSSLTFLLPEADAVLDYSATFVVEADGEAPGPVLWSLDGDAIGTSYVNGVSHQAVLSVETVEWPDGDYTMLAELEDWGLSASLDVVFSNGDLLVYDYPSVSYDPDASSPPSVVVTVPSPGVSIQFQVTNTSPVEWLWGPTLDPNGDWAIGAEETSLYPSFGSFAEPWAGGIPNHASTPWLTGDYRLYPYADTVADLVPQALVKRWFEEPTAGLLALDFYFVEGSGLSASSAPTDSNFIAFVDALEAVFLEVGIGLGEQRWFDVGDSDFAQISEYEELTELFASSVSSADRVLNVFFVEELDLPMGDPIGIASHIPGPALASGTGQSGVAMIAGPILEGDEWTAAALAGHEIGHYLGLMHTSEIGGGDHDPIADTPQACDSADCWETNLMDPYLFGTTELSAEQGWVVLRHPLVQLVDPSELPARSWSSLAPDSVEPSVSVAAFCATPRPLPGGLP